MEQPHHQSLLNAASMATEEIGGDVREQRRRAQEARFGLPFAGTSTNTMLVAGWVCAHIHHSSPHMLGSHRVLVEDTTLTLDFNSCDQGDENVKSNGVLRVKGVDGELNYVFRVRRVGSLEGGLRASWVSERPHPLSIMKALCQGMNALCTFLHPKPSKPRT
ncbi:hypothetical protein RIF29_15054 [Crotalaria pallida]|uniref:Uncharacterized protein n=1 Tax=Crotalaria pallida TaxID=3830 RepID=A0AAN9IEB2_CROPI